MKIIAIDPGQTTGYVEAEAADGDFTLTMVRQISWEERFALIDLLQAQPHANAVVVESFRLYAHKAQAQVNNDFPSVRIIGLVEAGLHLAGILDRIIFQPASVRTRVQVLPQHQQALKGSPHLHDAYQHLRYYYVTKLKPK